MEIINETKNDTIFMHIKSTTLKQNFQHHDEMIKDLAATHIQKYVRGYLARKAYARKAGLPISLLQRYQVQCQKAESSEIPVTNTPGKTRIYVPQETPEIILKRSGNHAATKRFGQMQHVRAILNSQNSTRLIIPRALPCGQFIVEQKLPVNTNIYYNMQVYVSQPRVFDKAICEFIRLYAEISIGDILVRRTSFFLGPIDGVQDHVRYDNLPLYIKNGKGFIGLIDLEGMVSAPHPQGMAILARIFPFHAPLIGKEATRLGLKYDIHALESTAAAGKRYLHFAFIDHLNWLNQRGVSRKHPFQSFEINPQKTEELAKRVEQELLRIHREFNPKGLIGRLGTTEVFFIDKPEESAERLSVGLTDLILFKIFTETKKYQENQLQNTSTQDLTDADLINLRSPYIDKFTCYKKEIMDLLQSKNANINFKNFTFSHDILQIASELVYFTMKQLELSDAIFSFKSNSEGFFLMKY